VQGGGGAAAAGRGIASAAGAIPSFPGRARGAERVRLAENTAAGNGGLAGCAGRHAPNNARCLENALAAWQTLLQRATDLVFAAVVTAGSGKRPQMAAIAAAWPNRVGRHLRTTHAPEDPGRILDDVPARIPAGTDLLVKGDRASRHALSIGAKQRPVIWCDRR